MSFHPEHFTVWAEIPVTDMDKAVAFYSAVLNTDMTIDSSGPNPIAVFQTKTPGQGVAGHLYPGVPAARGAGPTVHLAADGTAEDAMERVKAAGGTVVSPVIEIPAGRFAYCQDLDGNSFGVFEGT